MAIMTGSIKVYINIYIFMHLHLSKVKKINNELKFVHIITIFIKPQKENDNHASDYLM